MNGLLNTLYTAFAGMPWYGWVAIFTIGSGCIVALATRGRRPS